MSEVQFLFVVLGVLYAWECACWLRCGVLAFTTWTGRHWRLQHPAILLGNQRGGFVFAAPFPPLGTIHTANPFPFSPSPDGVLLFGRADANPGWHPTQTGRFITWDEASSLRIEGRNLLLRSEKAISASTVTLAQYLLKSLKNLSSLNRERRETAITQLLRDGFNLKQIESLLHDFEEQVRPIRLCANVLFVLVFALAPLLIEFVGLKLVWIWLLLGLLGLTMTTATFFAKVHRKFYPAATEDRFSHTLLIALAPATTMRAADTLSRPLFETYHPLAVAKTLLDPQAFRNCSRQYLLTLRNPTPVAGSELLPQAITTKDFYRRTMLAITEAWLAENHVSPDELCRPPQPSDDSCQAYCPRCEAQFTSHSGTCTDCGGLPLVPFVKPVETKPAAD